MTIFKYFLRGTNHFSYEETSTSSSSSLSLCVHIFNGQQQPDILELIHAGCVMGTQQQIHTLCQLTEVLPYLFHQHNDISFACWGGGRQRQGWVLRWGIAWAGFLRSYQIQKKSKLSQGCTVVTAPISYTYTRLNSFTIIPVSYLDRDIFCVGASNNN